MTSDDDIREVAAIDFLYKTMGNTYYNYIYI